jgi:tetratricopeptide (TPR) repeat protein
VKQLERARDLRQAWLGMDHPDTLTSMHELGHAYLWSGMADRAVPVLEETLKRRKATLGPEHVDTLKTMLPLSEAYNVTGKHDQALSLREETFRLRKTTLGPTHPRTLVAMRTLVTLYRTAGKLDQAQDLAQETLALTKATLGPEDTATLHVLTELGLCRLEAQQPAEAESWLRECLTIRQKNRPDLFKTFEVQSLLGKALLAQQRYAEADPLLQEGYEGLKQRAATIPAHFHHVDPTQALEWLVQLYDEWGKPDEAGKWRKELEGAKAAAKAPARP